MPTKKPPTVESVKKAALAALAQLGGSTTTEDDIVFTGRKIILPETLQGDLKKAISFLERKRAEDEMEFNFSHVFKYRPMDGAVATGNVIKNLFGMTLGKVIKTFFGDQPPQLIDVEVGVGETVQAPWGAMEVPGLDGLTLYLDDAVDEELGVVFQLWGEGPRKYRFAVEGLFKAIEHELATNSIYRGKAISGQQTPHFLDLSTIDPDSVIYSEQVLADLNANVWTPIEKAEELADLGEPGKRAVVFEGPYGTGKTLSAYLTAQRAVEHGWTFLMARPGRDNLSEVLQTARMYQPAVVFTEDIDTIASADTSSPIHISRILDMFDGLDTKGLRLMLVLTTNNIDTLHGGLLRPGRLDAVISIGALDQAGVEKLARYVLGTKLANDIDWEKVFVANEGYEPAFVREGLGRVVRYHVAAGTGDQVTTEDLVQAAQGLRKQHDMMLAAKAPKAGPPTLDRALTHTVEEAVQGVKVIRGAEPGIFARLQPNNR